MATKHPSSGTKHAQIKKASTTTFAAVAGAAAIVSISLVLLNILWGTAQFNGRVHDVQEESRDTLKANLDAVDGLTQSFNRLEIGDSLIPGQPEDKKNSEVVLDALPSKYDFPELATSINNLAEAASVDLESFRGSDQGASAVQSAPNPSPQPIQFSMDVAGSYQDISRFLLTVENSIRPIQVLSMELAGSDQKLLLSIDAVTYYQPSFDLRVQSEGVQ